MIRIQSSDRLREQFEVCVFCVPEISTTCGPKLTLHYYYAWFLLDVFSGTRYDGLHKVSPTNYIYFQLIKATQFVLKQIHEHSVCRHSFRKKLRNWLHICIVI
jgi:hypothetical protein